MTTPNTRGRTDIPRDHAEKMRKLELSAISTIVPGPSYLPSPASSSFKRLSTLSSPSSIELLNYQCGSSSRSLTAFPDFSSMDELLVKTGGNPRCLNLEVFNILHRHVGSVPEEGGEDYNSSTASFSKQGLHHSISVDRHLSSRQNTHRHQHDVQEKNQHVLGKPILSKEQIESYSMAY